MPKCSFCDKTAVVTYHWYNGVCHTIHHYCPTCRRKTAPPLRQFRNNGGHISYH